MTLKFYIRHHDKFLQDKIVLVFKSDEARDYFKQALKDCHFEEITSEDAHRAVRIGINGKIIPYGYTYKLTKEEMAELSPENWERTAELLAEGNERLYKMAKEKNKTNE